MGEDPRTCRLAVYAHCRHHRPLGSRKQARQQDHVGDHRLRHQRRRLYVWSEDAEVRPLPPKRWLNKFQAYALLNHGGDNKAAFRAIAAAARRGAA